MFVPNSHILQRALCRALLALACAQLAIGEEVKPSNSYSIVRLSEAQEFVDPSPTFVRLATFEEKIQLFPPQDAPQPREAPFSAPTPPGELESVTPNVLDEFEIGDLAPKTISVGRALLPVGSRAGMPELQTNQEAIAPFLSSDEVQPKVLRDAAEEPLSLPAPSLPETFHIEPRFNFNSDTPYGFTGPSGVLPSESQTSNHFIPVDDRWRLGQQDSDRYGKGHPAIDDYPGVKGILLDPYNQNVLKGDYPIFGQHTFLKLTAKNLTLVEPRQLPTPTTPFEATRRPGTAPFFGDPDQLVVASYNSFAIDLFHGNAAFKPNDWRVRVDLIYNFNNLTADELAIVSPDVRSGTARFRQDLALEEWFVEKKISDLSPYYDFCICTRW